MSNYKRNNRYSGNNKGYRRSSGADVFKAIGIVLVVFLVIGLIGSLFSRSPADPDTEETQSPTTSVTDPTDSLVPDKGYTVLGGTMEANGDVSILRQEQTRILFDGNSTAWELGGTINRLDAAEDLCFAFVISNGNRHLLVSASNQVGLCFGYINVDKHNLLGLDYDRYPYHLFDVTQYNLDATVLKQFSKDHTKNNLRFKAMIANDVFYVWYWYGDDTPTLCWKVPLTEDLEGCVHEGTYKEWSKPFTGFTPGSTYTLGLFNYGAYTSGSFADLTVKSGNEVDLSILPTE